MTTLILTAKHGFQETTGYARNLGPWRLAAVAALLALATADAEARQIIVNALSDAYLQVSVFVAGTLALFYGLEQGLKLDTAALLTRYRRWQMPAAAVLGALPGCGGAIFVITQYVKGRVGFGAMVAVLTATMGDAAFLLLAREPLTAVAISALGIVVGTVSGYAVELIHGPAFLRAENRESRAPCRSDTAEAAGSRWRQGWLILAVPGLVLGVSLALQYDPDVLFGPWADARPTLWLGAAGALLALIMWGYLPSDDSRNPPCAPAIEPLNPDPRATPAGRGPLDRVVRETNFVTVWVVFAFLAYELGVHFTGVDLKAGFDVWKPLVPLIGVLIGFLPGCGPQIVVTTLYLEGLVPLSAQIGNAVSNDGDALFPAIAVAPRTALVATLYSAVPAILVAYGHYVFFE